MNKYRMKSGATPSFREIMALLDVIEERGVYLDGELPSNLHLVLEVDPHAHGREVLWQAPMACVHGFPGQTIFLTEDGRCPDCGEKLV